MDDIHWEGTLNYPLLVVDNNPLQRSMVESSLKSVGCPVTFAENGIEALEIFSAGYFPVVMTEWLLPGMDGLELCRAIRKLDSGRYTFIILLISPDSGNDMIAGLEAGADEFIDRPVNQVALCTRLKTAKRILDLECSLKKSLEENERLSRVDPATGIYNRNYLDERIRLEIKRAYRYEHSLALIMVAFTQLRSIEEVYGQAAKDSVLNSCTRYLEATVRKDVDWLARFNDDTFVAVLPETDANGAMVLARRIRAGIASIVMEAGAPAVKVTASLGLAGFTAGRKSSGMTVQFLLNKANSVLSKALTEGNESINGIQLLG